MARVSGIRACQCLLRRPAPPGSIFLNTEQHLSIFTGKYRLSTLSKQLADGAFRASLSIRSGRGSASTDRVLRFTDLFGSDAEAHGYAHAQGLAWLAQALPSTYGLAC